MKKINKIDITTYKDNIIKDLEDYLLIAKNIHTEKDYSYLLNLLKGYPDSLTKELKRYPILENSRC
ncbi:MAG: hypothetical protein PWQ43_738 [Rikenellaceae bacterium]|nr:hypothetical protein [Rikenellaceae bacterium]